ncbi:MAG: prepilin-type N-terminal cleavage/methylation domain-containing protein [Pirellulaceae bacterium]|jgi:prepilin-type N-terminal cleavage/methylation domain-containing protein
MQRNNSLTVNYRIRRGFSLIEVMFSIAVVAIGLLGVLALFPAASHQAQQGLIADSAARMAHNAFREFDVRNMRSPLNWTVGDPNVNDAMIDTWHDQGHSFCIDPMFRDSAAFPYSSQYANTPLMHRVTLVNSLELRVNGNRVPLSEQLAVEIFMGQDDLSVDRPDDGQLPPSQQFGALDSRRQFDGRYSWMMTLVPELDPVFVKPGGNLSPDEQLLLDEPAMAANDQYLLSVVVFHQRNLGFDITTTDPAEHPEHVALVSFDGGGIGGGDISLNATSAEAIDVKDGQWIMLGGGLYAYDSQWDIDAGGSWGDSLPGRPQFPYFRWYRIIAAGNTAPLPNGTFVRSLTVAGPDWPLTPPPPGTLSSPPTYDQRRASSPFVHAIDTKAIIVKGIANVVERSVRLDDANLWRSTN